MAGNLYDKYGSRNPIARYLVRRFLEAADELVVISGATSIHEVGCGEGELSLYLASPQRALRAGDCSREIIQEADRRIRAAGKLVALKVADIYDLRPECNSAELVACCEVLEHVPDPDSAMRILAGLAHPFLLASVPREPIWRVLNVARGKYLRHCGNTPGHIQHWSRWAFIEFLEKYVEVVEVRTPLPWTMVLCRSRA